MNSPSANCPPTPTGSAKPSTCSALSSGSVNNASGNVHVTGLPCGRRMARSWLTVALVTTGGSFTPVTVTVSVCSVVSTRPRGAAGRGDDHDVFVVARGIHRVRARDVRRAFVVGRLAEAQHRGRRVELEPRQVRPAGERVGDRVPRCRDRWPPPCRLPSGSRPPRGLAGLLNTGAELPWANAGVARTSAAASASTSPAAVRRARTATQEPSRSRRLWRPGLVSSLPARRQAAPCGRSCWWGVQEFRVRTGAGAEGPGGRPDPAPPSQGMKPAGWQDVGSPCWIAAAPPATAHRRSQPSPAPRPAHFDPRPACRPPFA